LAQAPSAEHSAEIATSRETILVVEDELEVCNVIVEVARNDGYAVLAALNGSEALAVASQHRGPIHLLLTDLIMPGMSGRELAALLKVTRPDMIVLFMSGHTDTEIQRHDALEPGAVLLRKPFALDEFARVVREALDQRTA
jgi:two-component system cell cycle sensor histidine kinase/response regulator CckA